MIFTLGRLPLASPVLQAPMCGYTDLAFRRLARRFGCPLIFCEMVKDRAVLQDNAKTRELLATEAGDRPLGLQVVGREPDVVAEAARRLEGRGADAIDLNVGCPVPKIVREGCGAALLREPSRIGRIVERLVAAVRIPVTVKMRIGFDDGDAGVGVEVARLAESAGATAVIVHGRTRSQGFSGDVNTAAIRRIKEALRIPVIGNGGIRDGADAVRMRGESGCDAVMVGRGALGNPWIYRAVQAALAGAPAPPAPTVGERARVLSEHFGGMRALYGDARALRRVRSVIPWYVRGVDGAAGLRRDGMSLATAAQFDAWAARFAEAPPAAETTRGAPG